jgi:hypothetical protein
MSDSDSSDVESRHDSDDDYFPSADEDDNEPALTTAQAVRVVPIQAAKPVPVQAAKPSNSAAGGSSGTNNDDEFLANFTVEELDAHIKQNTEALKNVEATLAGNPMLVNVREVYDTKLRALQLAKDKKCADAPEERGFEHELPWDRHAPDSARRNLRRARINLARVAEPKEPKEGSAAALNQIVVKRKGKAPGTKRVTKTPVAPKVASGILYKQPTPEAYDNILSEEPLWELANKYNNGVPFPKPGPDQPGLHRRVSGNVSRFMRGDPMQAIIAHLFMQLCTTVTKMPQWGSDQGFGPGGGPYYSCGKTDVPPPDNYGMHSEVSVKGWTQISKANEQVLQCVYDWYVKGAVPTLFLRLKGGGGLGTTDASKTIDETCKYLKKLFDEVYASNLAYRAAGLLPGDRDRLVMKARCASRGDGLEFVGSGGYRLNGPQIFVACSNVVQLKPLVYGATTPAELTRFAAAGQPSGISLSYIMAGCVKEGDDPNDNPYLPIVDDPSRLGLPVSELTGRDRPRPALAATFDEDELNRSSTGKEAKETLLFQQAGGASRLMNRLSAEGCRPDEEDQMSDTDSDASSQARAEHDAMTFSDCVHGLRSVFCSVVKYTATPTDCVNNDVKDKRSQIVSHMVEMVPSKLYIGYNTGRMPVIGQHCLRHVEVVELPDRAPLERLNMTRLYPPIAKELLNIDIDLETGEGLPDAFSHRICGRTGCPIISLPKKKQGDVVGNTENGPITAGDLRDTVKKGQDVAKTAGKTGFWYADGNNVHVLLKDAENNRAAYPEGYRNMLMISNNTRLDAQKENWVATILNLTSAIPTDGTPDPRQLTQDLILLEWSHKYVRFSWACGGGVDEECLRQAFDHLAEFGGDTDNATSKAEAITFARSAVWYDEDLDPAERGASYHEAQETFASSLPCTYGSVISSISNINYAYSVLWKYLELVKAKAHLHSDEGAFLKILVVAGDICGRSVRLKTHDRHKFVLTDMLYSFDAGLKKAITMHAISVIQAVGRLCGIVPDPEGAPPIKLWIPTSCWAYTKQWMDLIDSLVPLHQLRKDNETIDDVILRVVEDETIPGFDALRVHFCTQTGEGNRGAKHYARIDHRLQAGKRASAKYSAITEEKGTTPDPVSVVDRSDEYLALQIRQCSEIAVKKTNAALAVDSDDEDSDSDEELEAAMGAPQLDGYESVPPPRYTPHKPATLAPKVSKKKKKSSGKRSRADDGADDDDYAFDTTDMSAAFEAVANISHLREALPSNPLMTSDRQLIDLWGYWYLYFLHINYGAQGPQADTTGGRHGIKSSQSRGQYAQTIRQVCNGPVGQSIFKSFTDLPQCNSSEDATRIKDLLGRICDAMNLSKERPSSKGPSNWDKNRNNKASHLNKCWALFPGTTDLRKWLVETQAPEQRPLPNRAPAPKAPRNGD